MAHTELPRPRFSLSQQSIVKRLFPGLARKPEIPFIEPADGIINVSNIKEIKVEGEFVEIEDRAERKFKFKGPELLNSIVTGDPDSENPDHFNANYTTKDRSGHKRLFKLKMHILDGVKIAQKLTEDLATSYEDLPYAFRGLWINIVRAEKQREFEVFGRIASIIGRLEEYTLSPKQIRSAYRLSIAAAVKKESILQTEEIERKSLSPLKEKELLPGENNKLIIPDENLELDPKTLASAIIAADWGDRAFLDNLFAGSPKDTDKINIYYPLNSEYGEQSHYTLEVTLADAIDLFKKSCSMLDLPPGVIPVSLAAYLVRVANLPVEQRNNFHHSDIAEKFLKFLRS